MENKLQLIFSIAAFVSVASLIPISKMRLKGKGVRAWRMIALTLLVIAAALNMFSPPAGGK